MFEEFGPYLIGGTKALVTHDVLDSASAIRAHYLGDPSDTKMNEYIAEVHQTIYYYSQLGIEVYFNEDDQGSWVHFAFIK